MLQPAASVVGRLIVFYLEFESHQLLALLTCLAGHQ